VELDEEDAKKENAAPTPKKGSSDDDAVLVEAGGPANANAKGSVRRKGKN
jgi:hypothetical protein